MLKFIFTFIVFLFYCFSTLASAQSLDPNLLLQLQANGINPADLQRLQQQSNQQQPQTTGPATAQTPAPASSVTPSPTLPPQVSKPEARPSSLLESYYRVLTGARLTLYGQDIFGSNADDEQLFFNTVGRDYVVAPGDVISVASRGISQFDTQYTVGSSGKISVQGLAPMSVTGRSIAEIEQMLTDEFQIDDASARVFVDLAAARLVPVQITGAVATPKTIAVPAYTPLSRVIAQMSGLSPQGSVRNILIQIGDQPVQKIDFYKFLAGDFGVADPAIVANARVHINDLGSTVAVAGFVGRPGIYELPEGQTSVSLPDLFDLANINLLPPGAQLEIVSFDASGQATSQQVSVTDDIQVVAGQALRLSFVETRDVATISVKGAVVDNFTLSQSNPVAVAKVLRNGAALKPDAVLEFAILYSRLANTQSTRAIDLRFAFANPEAVLMAPGEELIVFDTETFNALIASDLSQNKSTNAQLIRDARPTEIFFNETRVAYVAPYPETSVYDAIDAHVILPENTALDFAVMLDPQDRGKSARSFSLNAARLDPRSYVIPSGHRLQLFSEDFLRTVDLDTLAPRDRGFSPARNAILAAAPALLYLDGVRVAVLPTNQQLTQTQVAALLQSKQDIYPLYTSVLSRQPGTLFYNNRAVRLDAVFTQSANFALNAGDRVDVFTLPFIRKLFDGTEDAIAGTTTPDDTVLQEDDLIKTIEQQAAQATGQQLNTTVKEQSKSAVNGLIASARLISGAVEAPGLYPVASGVSLAELISIAGGVLPSADTGNLVLREYQVTSGGNLNLRRSRSIDITSVAPHRINLRGAYDVFVPALVNNAASGTIVLSGEVRRPGEYTFGRNETLHDVIKRAGGLTNVAYPLGAVFTRESLKGEQRSANMALARQVEQSILSLSQSQRDGAGEQISAVITFANQLKVAPVSGRQTVNVSLRERSSPIFLEDGDRITIPKRPSHVSVIGSVYSQVSAAYSSDKYVGDYISDAGGFDRIADQKNIFMVLPNGQSMPIGAGAKADTIIPPGAVIVVPPKTDKLTLLGLTEIVSKILGNIATSLLAINAVK